MPPNARATPPRAESRPTTTGSSGTRTGRSFNHEDRADEEDEADEVEDGPLNEGRMDLMSSKGDWAIQWVYRGPGIRFGEVDPS